VWQSLIEFPLVISEYSWRKKYKIKNNSDKYSVYYNLIGGLVTFADLIH